MRNDGCVLSHGHKNTVLCVKWNQNGNWVLTASKDQIIKVINFSHWRYSSESWISVSSYSLFPLCSLIYLFFLLQLYDIRAMKELESFRGHRKDVTGN